MIRSLALERPLAFFDLETTSARVNEARIVEISVAFFHPAVEEPEVRTRRVNPGVPIPAEATEIHGITDDDVAGEPDFTRFAGSLLLQLDNCDLGGFNLRRYDLPVLEAEFNRSGMSLDVTDRILLDPMVIMHRMERRDLSAAVEFYLGRTHDAAHSAREDTLAAAEILFAQVRRYAAAGLPQTGRELHAWMDESHRFETPIDAWFNRTSDKPVDWVFRRGKQEGRTLGWVAQNESGYLWWMTNKADDMPAVVRETVRPFVRS